jgi:membrane peptidoglycan carboxypeptidase
MRTSPHFVSKVVDSTGNVMYQANVAPQPAFSPDDPDQNGKLARNVTESLLDVASHSGVPIDGGRPVAAKTGTAQFQDSGHNMAAWMVGYTPQVATAVWVGNKDKPGPIFGNYHNTIGPSHDYDIYGREEPSYIWQLFMNSYLKGKPVEQFPAFEPLGTNSNFSGHTTTTVPPTTTTTEPAPPSTTTETTTETTTRTTKPRPCDVFGCPPTDTTTDTTTTDRVTGRPGPGGG